ncbi:hypothetical protein HPB52_008037 [Rhipicephalus sanguineus]|uniref:Endonuclease/exonuclease/phosphatase domain-containing protein n=1 Tax=Rhipicephalus sanguineus TaxID=34632 RepID=A0A9D4T344_RHISA|nr:hypothetical protein HPB52_008037 [Rhipicephalus sanguineus]
MDELGLILLNEPASHTRIGQGACRDTSPDLSIWSDAGTIAWSNSFEDLGSDHRVLCVTVGEDESEVDVCRKARVVDWDKFRETREREKQDGPIEDIGEWCRRLLADGAGTAIVVRDSDGGTAVEATGSGAAAIDTTTTSVVAATEVVPQGARDQMPA